MTSYVTGQLAQWLGLSSGSQSHSKVCAPVEWTSSKLGNGAFSEVYLVRDSQQRRFAAKRAKQGNESLIQKESLILAVLIHDHVIRSYGLIRFRQQEDTLILDLHGKTLKQEFIDGGTIKEEALHCLCRQLFNTLEYLRSKKIAHRDLKPENLFFNNNHLTVADFGAAGALGPQNILDKYRVQTYWYRAPEVVLEIPYNCDVDTWSAGVIILQLLTRRPPYPATRMIRTEGDFSSKVRRYQLLCLASLINEKIPELWWSNALIDSDNGEVITLPRINDWSEKIVMRGGDQLEETIRKEGAAGYSDEAIQRYTSVLRRIFRWKGRPPPAKLEEMFSE